MNINFDSIGDFEKTKTWLKKVSQGVPTKSLKTIGEEGVEALRRATPVGATGETSNGWKMIITTDSKGAELSFVNNAHPETSANVAVLIDTGHGTRNGGYVPARPYIRQAIRPVLEKAGDLVLKEMTD